MCKGHIEWAVIGDREAIIEGVLPWEYLCNHVQAEIELVKEDRIVEKEATLFYYRAKR